jgi:hypothetical protein
LVRAEICQQLRDGIVLLVFLGCAIFSTATNAQGSAGVDPKHRECAVTRNG